MASSNEIVEVAKEGDKFRKDLAEKRGDWKSKLSAAFNSEQIFFSLFVLSLFYVGYAIANAFHDTNAKNEDDIIENCYCNQSHQSFYISWFVICSFIWLLLHSYTYVAIRFPPCADCFRILRWLKDTPKNLWKYRKQIFCCKKCRKGEREISGSNVTSENHQGKQNADKIKQSVKVLWFQYYKLFVVGYPKKYETIALDSSESHSGDKKINDEKDEENDLCTCFCCTAYINEENIEQGQEENCTCGCDKKLSPCFNFLRCINRSVLLIVKFFAQLVTIPLLFLQIFDTHSLLCFNPPWFCSDEKGYSLHLAQAVITLLFYSSLALSQLASTLLTYNPWPRKTDAVYA